MATHAHTRPFRRKWLNIITGLFLPTGVFFYLRMCRFRLRLRKDLYMILDTNQQVAKRISVIVPSTPSTLEELEKMPFIIDLLRNIDHDNNK